MGNQNDVPTPALLRAGGTCVCFNLRKAARAVTRIYDEAFKPVGLRATQFTLLAALKSTGPATVNDLAERLVMDRTTLSRNLGILQKKGLVEISAGQDRRERHARLTDAGGAVLAAAWPVWEATQRRMVEAMGGERAGQLLADLRSVVEMARDELGADEE